MSTVYAFSDPAASGAPILRESVFGALEAAAAASATGSGNVGTTLLVCERAGEDVSVVAAIDAAAPLRGVVAQVTEWTGCGISTRGSGARLVAAAAEAVCLVIAAHGSAGRSTTAESWLSRALAVGAIAPAA